MTKEESKAFQDENLRGQGNTLFEELKLIDCFVAARQEGRQFVPASLQESGKYGGSIGGAGSAFESMDICSEAKSALTRLSSYGLARGTWQSYKTAERLLLMCQRDTKKKLELPFTEERTLTFIDWLIRKRKVKGSTVSSYLAGIRQLHILRGLEPPTLRTGLVNLVLKGKANLDALENRTADNRGRLPMTIPLMRLLKEKIRTCSEQNSTKSLLWTVATLAFHGLFRIHELLCKNETFFDPDFTLLTEDVSLTNIKDDLREVRTVLHIKLKSPKERKDGSTTIVDIFETGTDLCPIRAFKKWDKDDKKETRLPCFRDKTGIPLTGRKINGVIKRLLAKHIDYNVGQITSHSFRSGIPSMMGLMGYDDEQTKIMGRWSSRAFSAYMKNDRTKRATMAKEIASWT